MVNENESVLICNGKFELFRIQKNFFDEVIEFCKNNFPINEPVHNALGLSNSVTVKEEIGAIVRACLEDEVSFAVRDCKTKQLVSVRVCRIVNPENYSAGNIPSPPIGEFLYRLKTPFNIFKEWHIDCALEFSFLATRPDFGGLGLGTILSQHAIEFARQMLNGTLKERAKLPVHIRDSKPQAVCSIYSSKYSQKVGEKLGMQTLVKIPYTEFFHNGKSFAETMNPIHEHATYVAMKL